MTVVISGDTGIDLIQDGAVSSAAKLASGVITAPKLDGAQTGAPPVFGCRAWVSFDGSRNSGGGTDAAFTNRFIRSSGNVTSVLKVASGHYRVTMTTAMPDAEYGVFGGTNANYAVRAAGGVSINSNPSWAEVPTTTTVFDVVFSDDASGMINPKYGSLFVFR